VLLVQINPIQRRELPTRARAIQDRLNEITFNASLLREFRAIDFVNRLVDAGKLPRDEYKRVLMHRIDGGPPLAELVSSSRMNADWSFLLKLRDIGRAAGKRWLKRNYEAIGKSGTLDLREAFG
jgi:NTE family protein